MAYSELIKDFSGIRNYMRDFYVFGFRRRDEFGAKSARSYDNERRRLESWFGEAIRFQQTLSGKQVFLSVSGRTAARNPLYRAFRAGSFTDGDIVFHFLLLDLLYGDRALTLREIVAGMDAFDPTGRGKLFPDESTVRKKLKEYQSLGVVTAEKRGSRLVWRFTRNSVSLPRWADCVAFFSEAAPLGVVGSYLSGFLPPRGADAEIPFRFKDHYLLNALDSEILFRLLLAVRERRRAVIGMWTMTGNRVIKHDICPARFFVSTSTGRQYVLATQRSDSRPLFFRLDLIRSVTPGPPEPAFDRLREQCDAYREHLWGVSGTPQSAVDRLEMRLRITEEDGEVLDRLLREKRGGAVFREGPDAWVFSIEVYDASEMLPWIRTFTGHITSLSCSNPHIVSRYRDDLNKTLELYEGNADDFS